MLNDMYHNYAIDLFTDEDIGLKTLLTYIRRLNMQGMKQFWTQFIFDPGQSLLSHKINELLLACGIEDQNCELNSDLKETHMMQNSTTIDDHNNDYDYLDGKTYPPLSSFTKDIDSLSCFPFNFKIIQEKFNLYMKIKCDPNYNPIGYYHPKDFLTVLSSYITEGPYSNQDNKSADLNVIFPYDRQSKN